MTLIELKKLVDEAYDRFGSQIEVYVDVYEQIAIHTQPEHYIDMDLKQITQRVVT